MDFNKMTLYEFCLWLSGYYDDILDVLKGIDFENTLQIEMYDFIKIKTDNFECQKFHYFIKDLRDFAWNFPYDLLIKEANESETGYPEYITSRLISNNNDYDIDFAEEDTLRDRIEKMKLIIGNEKMYPTEKILLFSDVAEEEYKKICGKVEKDLVMGKEEKALNWYNQIFQTQKDFELFQYLQKEFIIDTLTDYSCIFRVMKEQKRIFANNTKYIEFLKEIDIQISRIKTIDEFSKDKILLCKKLIDDYTTLNNLEA